MKVWQTTNPIKLPGNKNQYRDQNIAGEYGLDQAFVVTTLSARMEKSKGIQRILDTARLIKEKDCRDVKFLFVGGNREAVKHWAEYTKHHQIEDIVVFAGYLRLTYTFHFHPVFPPLTGFLIKVRTVLL